MHHRLPKGLTYVEHFITPQQELELIDAVERMSWSTVGSGQNSRKVQQYGKNYNYATRTLDDAPDIPEFLIWLLPLVAHAWDAPEPDQIIINKYEAGQGIGAHTDHVRLFGPNIASLSLNSPATMTFWSTEKQDQVDLVLAPRSIVLLQGESRYKWTHEIKPSARSKQRISITFRTVR